MTLGDFASRVYDLCMTESSIIVLGSINTDLVIRAVRLPALGETVVGGEYFEAPGGKGANQAVAAARAKDDSVVFVAAVGEDGFGTQAIRQLAKDNIRTDYIKTVSGRPSGVALIMVDASGENCISVASGANSELTPDDVNAVPEELFTEAKVFLTNCESPLDAVARGLERAKRAGLMTILNPAPAPVDLEIAPLLAHVDIVTPNVHEAATLTGIEIVNDHTAIAAGRWLKQLGCQASIITRGADGCVVVGDKTMCLSARPVKVVDTTAAGDAFNGALAAALARDNALDMAARWANIAAAISVTRPGAQPSLPRLSEIKTEWEKAK